MARVLITGAAGFIGSHLASACLDRGYSVHAVIRPGSPHHRLRGIKNRLCLHQFDIADRERLSECFAEAKPEQVFHLATRTKWKDETDFADAFGSVTDDLVNLLTLLATAEAARPAPRVVVRAGSLAEYGPGPTPFQESQREMPVNSYAAALVAGTHYAQMLQPRLSFPVITGRLALLYGPGQSEDFLVPRLIHHCLAGQSTTILRPEDRRDLMHVEDAVDALLRLAAAPPPGLGVVNIATGIAPKMAEVADLVVHSTDADSAVVELGDEGAEGGVADLCGSPALLKDLTGWEARISLSEGVDQTVAWYRNLQSFQ